MRCHEVESRLSAHLDRELPPAEAAAVETHLADCARCARVLAGLSEAVRSLADLPRLDCGGEVASEVLGRIEVETRGPGLALVFRGTWASRPLILPSLVPAALVLVTVLAGAVALHRPSRTEALVVRSRVPSWDTPLPPSGTEGNPLFPSAGVGVPQVRGRAAMPEGWLEGGLGDDLFLETVVARDGSVSAVRLLEGDRDLAGPVLDALRGERFEPTRLRGRPVAVSLYRLISRVEVRPPVT